jgi:hypothetical protein
MGMFDWVKVSEDIELPIPAEIKDARSQLEFQTKDLENCLSTYELRKDGVFLLQNGSLKNIDFHGFLNFGACYSTDLVDYIVDYKAKYTDSVLNSIVVLKFVECFHESKNKSFEELKKTQAEFNNRLSNRLLRSVQSYFVAFLRLFGLDICNNSTGFIFGKRFSIIFYCPKILFVFRRDKRWKSVSRYYGFALEKIDTCVKFQTESYEKSFSFKVLGFGFEIKMYKAGLFEEFCVEEPKRR